MKRNQPVPFSKKDNKRWWVLFSFMCTCMYMCERERKLLQVVDCLCQQIGRTCLDTASKKHVPAIK